MKSGQKPARPRARSEDAKDAKRNELLRSALELFTEYGFQRTSIGMITEKAGLSTGAFYLYFKGKVEVYRILNAEGNEILLRLLQDVLTWPGMTPLSQLSAMANAYYRFYTEHRGHYEISSIHNIGQKAFFQNEEMLEHLNQQAGRILKLVESVLQKGVEAGELKKTDTWQATKALWGMLDGMFIMEARESRDLIGDSFQDLFKQGLNIVFHGLIGKPS
ncbi:MAG: TetR/AcrR family transcriptional regulator [Proteobacteria bacterium]|nr:TetR/AcrR family transcriptional regulator [Pseudomonadota bacterium]